ncbi:MAG: mucoidy inhibitor MuiA family protein [Phycisphaerales bacterium]|jgi:uncharacterized protein (TIGR02231 family)|nr:mucoidy inhibitor MuiA family protein [Phycisphaerales bacterium]
MNGYKLALITTAILSLELQAQVSLNYEPAEANSTISAVTLYRNRASITRTTSLDLEAGGHALFFRDLPSSAYLDSVQAHVSDNASLLSVETSNKPIAKDNSELVAEIDKEIEEVEELIDQVNSEGKAIGLQIDMLKTLIEHASNDKAPPINLENFDEQLVFIGEQMSELTLKQIQNESKNKDLKKILLTLEQRKRDIGHEKRNQIDAIVDIAVKNKCTVTVKLTYLVTNANWQPAYSIRANSKGNEITIDYDAEIAQKTGENWNDVSLILSTAQPQQSTTPPMPHPWFVDVYVPVTTPPVNPQVRRSMKLGTSLNLLDASSEGLVEAASAAASIVGDGPAVSFVLPRTVTIPSNAKDRQTTSIASIETTADLFRIAVPMITDSVFIRSNVTNESDYILLPGRASIFHGGDYVGKTNLQTVAPNEKFPLDLGIDPIVTSSKALLEKITSSTGMFSSGKQTIYDYLIKISNGHDESIDLRIWDRIPVSRNEEIEVVIKDLSLPLSSDVYYLETDRPLGLLRWDSTIPANMTGDNSFTLNWRVEVARGKNIEMTPLPD